MGDGNTMTTMLPQSLERQPNGATLGVRAKLAEYGSPLAKPPPWISPDASLGQIGRILVSGAKNVGARWLALPGDIQRQRDEFLSEGLRGLASALTGREIPALPPLGQRDQFPGYEAIRARLGEP